MVHQHGPELPPELWAKICSFLPSAALKRLYTVNSLFFDLAMTERYREFNMEVDPITVASDFQRLCDPFIASKIRAVVLAPDHLPITTEGVPQNHHPARAQQKQKTHSKSLSAKLTQLVVSPLRRRLELPDMDPPLSPEEISGLLKVALTNMTRVESFTIVWDTAASNGRPSEERRLTTLATEYIACAWESFSPCLERFSMRISPNKMAVIFPFLPTLTKLKWLDISVEYGDFEPEGLDLLVSFLNSLCNTLRTLHITVVAVIDLSALFQGLVHFPHLQTVHFTLPGRFSEPTHLYNFLNLHSNELTSFHCFGNFDSPPILPKLTTRYLRRLEIDPRLLLDEWSTPVGLQDLKALKEVELICPIPGSQIVSFLQFCATTETLALDRLHLCLVELTSSLLELIARSLPKLKILSLEIIYVVDQKSVTVKPESYFPLKTDMGLPTNNSFAYELRLRSVLDPFKQWELYDISIKRHPYICWGIMNILAECVPSIQSFYGRHHKEMPREALTWMA